MTTVRLSATDRFVKNCDLSESQSIKKVFDFR